MLRATIFYDFSSQPFRYFGASWVDVDPLFFSSNSPKQRGTHCFPILGLIFDSFLRKPFDHGTVRPAPSGMPGRWRPSRAPFEGAPDGSRRCGEGWKRRCVSQRVIPAAGMTLWDTHLLPHPRVLLLLGRRRPHPLEPTTQTGG